MIALLPFFPRAVSGLERTGLATWRATDGDPQFVLRLRWPRPRYLILYAQGLDRALDPELLLDRGRGFNGQEIFSLGRAGNLLVCLNVASMPDLKAIRLDPATRPAHLRLVCLATDNRTVARFVSRRLRKLRSPHGPLRVEEIGAGEAAKTFWAGGSRIVFHTPEEHYRHVVAMAEDGPVPEPVAEPALSFLVPVFNTKTRYLDELLASFRAQPPGSARLILSDDGSRSAETLGWLRAHADEPGVRVLLAGENRGIAAATNAALGMSTTPWTALLDHDDALSPGAVAAILAVLSGRPDADFLYTDEVLVDDDLKPIDAFFKPAFDPVLLSGVNYINHLSVYRTERLKRIGGLRDGFQGSQDYDLLLRYLQGIDPGRVLHLPFPAYQWRRSGETFSATFEDEAIARARDALSGHFARDGRSATVEAALYPPLHRVRLDLAVSDWPKLTVVIPSRDHHDLLAETLDGLTTRTDYPDLRIVVVDNGSTDPRVLALYDRFRAEHPDFVADVRTEPFNFSRSVNRGFALAEGRHVLLLNNDIEVIEPGWLKEMVSCLGYDGAGIVGARLLYPDRSLQHAGVIVGFGDLAGHWFHGKSDTFPGPMGRLAVRQTLSAVTGAAMLISRPCLDAVGPFDADLFAIAYNDVDYCLRAAEAGFRTVYTPFATLIHHESASRGSDERPATVERFRREQENLKARHGTAGFTDRASNPWYSRDRTVPEPRGLAAIPPAR